MLALMEPEVDDKVRLKDHTSAPVRGVVAAVHGDELLVRLDESGSLLPLRLHALQISAWRHGRHGRTCHIGVLAVLKGHVIATGSP